MSRSNSVTAAGYRLKVIRQLSAPVEHVLEDGRSVFVGKGDSCGIKIDGIGVAEIHSLLEVDGDSVWIQDWASDAGTLVNGRPIDEKTQINFGDSVVVGNITLELVGDAISAQKEAEIERQAAAANESREESVGMEAMGRGPQDGESLGIIEPQSAFNSEVRLSDAFSGGTDDETSEESKTPVSEIDEPIVELNEVDGDEATSVLADTASSEEASVDTFEPASDLKEDQAIDDELDGIHQDIDATDFDDDFTNRSLTAGDLDWDPALLDEDQMDAEIIALLKSEIEDLRIQLAERDEEIASIQRDGSVEAGPVSSSVSDPDFGGGDLVGRVDELLAELSEHDEKVATLQDMLQASEIQNQAERDERSCLETWVGEIEQRFSQRETEWQAERDGLQQRLDELVEERDRYQRQLHSAAQRFGQAAVSDEVSDETVAKLQEGNAKLQSELDEALKQCTQLGRQIERLQTEESETLQKERAELAREKANTSRMRFELSKQLQEIGSVPVAKEQPDREFAMKLQTLREHLREIHEEEKDTRGQKGDSLFGRISGLWKRVDDEF